MTNVREFRRFYRPTRCLFSRRKPKPDQLLTVPSNQISSSSFCSILLAIVKPRLCWEIATSYLGSRIHNLASGTYTAFLR